MGEISLALQSKLLRVLQEGQYERVGDERTKKVDVRLIAAANKNLQEEVEAGNFNGYSTVLVSLQNSFMTDLASCYYDKWIKVY